MYSIIKKKHDSIKLTDLNNIIVVISLIPFIFNLCYTNNIFVIIIMSVFIYELSSHLNNNKIIRFLSNVLIVLILGYYALQFVNLLTLTVIVNKILLIIIKILLLIIYLLIVFINIKSKNIKLVKNKKSNIKNYTFKELRNKKRDYFKKETIDLINNYKNNNNISSNSDYYKVLENNIDSKTSYDLEEYIWVNYLRFYKNKSICKKNIFDKINIIFILIHIVIFILAIVC